MRIRWSAQVEGATAPGIPARPGRGVRVYLCRPARRAHGAIGGLGDAHAFPRLRGNEHLH